ncbi:hypothetical protein F4820DRAFT_271977 [Hypoxylon rubiginosum]|uniref:Uncharacterized protein n=1 Tax=Hypoxylon rubiginosum TaxID=110542 RepID=A0ACB9Z3C1_9PEZI|nr:hypothetical protein F4820DRAFT_271977 [Hypoxylon rubiginosum]
MLPPLPWSGLDLFYHTILAVYLVIFLFFHANQIRSVVLIMADMMNPQTPPRKLFKPSSKTKTPTPAKRQTPTTPTNPSTQSHDTLTLTPTETVSQSAERPGFLSRGASEVSKSAIDSSTEGEDALKGPNNVVKSIAGKPREILDSSTGQLPEPSNPTDALNSPTDIAKYFTEQGNSEMSTFISALAGKTSLDPTGTAGRGVDSRDMPGDAADVTSQATGRPASGASESINELPRDDALITSPNERTKEVLDEASDLTNTAGKLRENGHASNGVAQKAEDMKNSDQSPSLAREALDAPKPVDVSKEAEGSTNAAQEQVKGVKPLSTGGEPDTANISKEARVGVLNEKGRKNGLTRAASDATGRKASALASNDSSDGTQVADNMGKPAHIERRIEIPLSHPEKAVSSPPEPNKPDMHQIAAGLHSVDDLPGTEDLPSTDDLPGLPDDMLQDPPEEVLDPSVHTPSSNITPIPKIPKITPIGIAPPPDLLHLAHGLGGNMVDDVGNIVDASGEVLGHATGDLPAMVGKKVADNGEVYGENGEVVGYVSENFTEPPAPTDIPDHVLGGLKVDHYGNILDTNGNIIGRFNEKAGENGSLAPFLNRRKSSNSQAEGKSEEEKKPKVNAHTGGSPSDLFLDVKSTTDGIQLTIRIPTTFGRQPQD